MHSRLVMTAEFLFMLSESCRKLSEVEIVRNPTKDVIMTGKIVINENGSQCRTD